jgi:hypothetical protein
MEDVDCGACSYSVVFVNRHDVPVAECRRYPPVVLLSAGGIIEVFPDATRRCGEYKEESPWR